jgi:hypothetical protein
MKWAAIEAWPSQEDMAGPRSMKATRDSPGAREHILLDKSLFVFM